MIKLASVICKYQASGKVLNAGVYKCTEEGRVAFHRFVDAVNGR